YIRGHELQDAWPGRRIRVPFAAEEPGIRRGRYSDDRHRSWRNYRHFLHRELRAAAAVALQERRSTAWAHGNRSRAQPGGNPGVVHQAATPAAGRAHAGV